MCQNIFGQRVVEAEDITIDFDRVVHIVLTTNVEYVSAGSGLIEAKKVEESPNIVKIVALEENFKGVTNVTVISKAGDIYPFNITYQANINAPSVFFPDVDKTEDVFFVKMNKLNSAHLIFPNNLVYFQQGNEDNFKVNQTSAANILRVEKGQIFDNASISNLFCVDAQGLDYNINLSVGENDSYTYTILPTGFSIGNNDDHKVMANVNLNQDDLEGICVDLLDRKRKINSQGLKKNKYEFSLNNLFVDDRHLFFVFELKNGSNINLGIDFVKCFFVDEKENKNAVQQESVVDYKFNYNFDNVVESKGKSKFVLVFDKFTIPDKKVFKVEIYEKGGGRHINFKLKNNIIINADAL